MRWTVGIVAVAAGGLSLAGCHRPTIVEGVVWFDTDFDGLRDPDETVAPGVSVEVSCHYTDPARFSDGQCDTATTDSDGRYRLLVPVDPSGETQGIVSFVAPTGFRAVEPADVEWFFSFTHDEQRDLAGIDAALVSTSVGSLGDLVWHDDGDGIQEGGEPGVAGIPVELQVGLGQLVAATVTGPDGRYLFEDVPEGRHTVRFGPLPAGLRFAPDLRGLSGEDSDANPYSGRADVIVEGGAADLTIDAGIVTAAPGELGLIGDRVWTDLDFDGVQDPGEPGEAGVEVLLVGANTGQLSFTVTDADGRYSFLVSRAIAPDQPYRIVFAAPPGRVLSPPDAGGDDGSDSDPDPLTGSTADVTLGPDEVDTSVDAGLRSPGVPATIGDFVWRDLDRDGIQEAGEPALPNVTVTLRDAQGTVVASTATDETGRYLFTNVAAGTYRLRFTSPPGLQPTTADAGSDDSLDSDINGGGETPLFTIAGGVDLSFDAGYTLLA
jgi:SdrD B-like domain